VQKPSSWSQSVSYYPHKDPTKAIEGTGLSMFVRARPDSELSLKNGSKLEDHDIHLSIFQGEFPPEEFHKARFAPDAIGGLWYIEEQDYVHGWFYFRQHNYAAVWDQVRAGGYTRCTVTLGIRPEKFEVWTDNPLSIVSAAVNFDRLAAADSAAKHPSRKSWFSRI
jgi:hypothetical protein